MSTFPHSKRINARIKDLINGYIRECQAELFGDLVMENAYYNIPQLINTHCMAFYEVLTWYKGNENENFRIYIRF